MLRRFSRVRGPGLFLVGVWTAAGCAQAQESSPSGALGFRIDSDLRVPDAMDRVDVRLYLGSEIMEERTLPLHEAGHTLPQSFLWKPTRSIRGEIRARAVGYRAGNPIVLIERWVPIPMGQTRSIPLFLSSRCMYQASFRSLGPRADVVNVCPEHESCEYGACQLANEIGVEGEPSALPELPAKGLPLPSSSDPSSDPISGGGQGAPLSLDAGVGNGPPVGPDGGAMPDAQAGPGRPVFSCADPPPPPSEFGTLRGTIEGLRDDGLVLRLNRTHDLSVTKGSVNFAFPQALPVGSHYAVEVANAPADGADCVVLGGRGVVPSSEPAKSIQVQCQPRQAIRQVVMGRHHGCALFESGQVRCWGNNNSGELGQSSLYASVPGLQGASRIASGPSTSCVVLTNGTVRCWGADTNGVRAGSSESTSIPGLSGVRDVSVGEGFACALSDDSTVRCWGSNSEGETAGSSTNQAIAGLSGVVQISSGLHHTCAVLEDSTVRCWGSPGANALAGSSPTASIPGLSGVQRVAIGDTHACALLGNGTVRCWGNPSWNTHHQSSLTSPVSGIANAVSLTARRFTTCAVLQDGTVACWGGEAVAGPVPFGASAKPIAGLTGAVQVAVADSSGCALRMDRTIACWTGDWQLYGIEPTAQLDPFPPVPGLSGAARVYGGHDASCAIMGDSTFRCWGGGARAGERIRGASSSTRSLAGLSGVIQAAVGGGNACAILRDRSLRCWGTELYGAFPSSVTQPFPMVDDVQDVAVGSHAGCAVRADSTVTCFGWAGQYSQAEHAAANYPFRPFAVDGLSGVVQVSMISMLTGVRLKDGTVQFWGGFYGNTNVSPQVRDLFLDPKDPFVPKAIPGLSGTLQLAVGDAHACGLMPDGTVRCWGDNTFAQTAGSSTTSAIPGLKDVVQLAAGLNHTCARLRDGTVRCWGQTDFDQTGGASPTQAVPFLNGVIDIGAGAFHTCALHCDGSVLCWGYNRFGTATGTRQMLITVPFGR